MLINFEIFFILITKTRFNIQIVIISDNIILTLISC